MCPRQYSPAASPGMEGSVTHEPLLRNHSSPPYCPINESLGRRTEIRPGVGRQPGLSMLAVPMGRGDVVLAISAEGIGSIDDCP